MDRWRNLALIKSVLASRLGVLLFALPGQWPYSVGSCRSSRLGNLQYRLIVDAGGEYGIREVSIP